MAGSLFRAEDVPALAAKAGLAIREGANPRVLADAMNRVLLDAHHASLVVQGTPAPGRLREAFKGVAEKGRELLLALGIDGSPADIARLDRMSVPKRSKVIYDLIRCSPPRGEPGLPPGVFNAYGWNGDPETELHRLVVGRYIMEAARAIAFLAAYAEAAQPAGGRRGRRRGAFAPRFLEGMALVYHDTFDGWPALRQAAHGERGGPSLEWLGELLRLAVERLPGCMVTEKDALAGALDRLRVNEPETVGSDFEKATARAKARRLPQD